jgi:hypothetical protein
MLRSLQALAAGLAAAAILGLILVPAPVAAEPPPPDRQATGPAISFIDSPTATCYQSQTGECFINWGSFAVSASPSYMVYFTVTIDNRLRALYSGFFQTSMTIASDMHGMGFKVPCGGPSATDIAPVGRIHSWQAAAQASDGLKSNNYGSVTCPPALYFYLPLVVRAH